MGQAALITKKFMQSSAANKRALAALKKRHAAFIRDLPSKDIETLSGHLAGPYHAMDLGYKGEQYGSEDLAARLEEIMRRAPRAPEDLTVWRGSTEGQFEPKHGYPFTTTYEPGSAYTYAEGWMDPHPAKDPALIGEIQVPRGSPGIMFDEPAWKDVTGEHMPFSDEAELVLPQGKMTTVEELRELVEVLGAPSSLADYRIKQKVKKYEPPFQTGGLVNGYT
jgi:hypothetical protein